jgi:hypothetical protein
MTTAVILGWSIQASISIAPGEWITTTTLSVLL